MKFEKKNVICLLIPIIGLMGSVQNSFAQNPDRLDLLDKFIEQSVADGILPGGVFKLNLNGTSIFSKTVGHIDTQQSRAYRDDDIFRIASMTKAITSVAIMQLYENGQLLIDDRVSKYIPSFADTKVLDQFNEADSSYTVKDLARPITIRHLMTHTSGIYYGAFAQDEFRAVYMKNDAMGYGLSHESVTTEEMVNHIATLPLAHQPGESWSYGMNMEVMGRIVEVVSEMSLAEYFKKYIFEPLHMKDTHFYLPESKVDRLVPIFVQNEDGTTTMSEDPNTDYPMNGFDQHFAGGGGLSSTATDYMQFVQALVNGGTLAGRRILGPKTIEYMSAAQTTYLLPPPNRVSRQRGTSFGLGFQVYTDDSKGAVPHTPGTYDWGGLFNTKFWIDPNEQMVFVGMTQVLPFRHGDFWNKLYAIIYSVLEE